MAVPSSSIEAVDEVTVGITVPTAGSSVGLWKSVNELPVMTGAPAAEPEADGMSDGRSDEPPSVLPFEDSQIAPAAASFHIIGRITRTFADPNNDIDDLIACAANYYNCKCIGDGDRGSFVEDYDLSTLPDDGCFQLRSGLCGKGAMNFYSVGGDRWEFYDHNGNGQRLGECWENHDSAITSCTSVGQSSTAVSRLICYTDICG